MKYGVIMADPPWEYQRTVGQGIAADHYPTMSMEALRVLPVWELTAPDCALFLWATLPMLREALELIEAWGFSYKTTAFVWLKTNRQFPTLFWGMGSWTRANAELCLLATKGHPKRVARNVHQIIIAPLEEHSKKPDEVRTRIEALMGDAPRIELFARQPTPGWDVWGNEVISDIEMRPDLGRIF